MRQYRQLTEEERIEPVESLKAYVTGQLSDLQRKSIEPMADGPGTGKILGTDSRNYYSNATPYSLFSPLPYEKKTKAIA